MADRKHIVVCLNGQNGGGNGDYTGLAACIAGELVANADLVDADIYLDIEILGEWASDDTTRVDVNGFTASADCYRNIYTTGASRHDGKRIRSKALTYRLVESGQYNTPFTIQDDYVYVDGLQIERTAASSSSAAVVRHVTAGSHSVLKNCIVKGVNHTGAAIQFQRKNHVIVNNVVESTPADGIGVTGEVSTDSDVIVANNTVYAFGSSSTGVNASNNNTRGQIRNNLVIGDGTCYAFRNVTNSNNGSSDETGNAGLHELTTAEFVSVTAGSVDLHLASGASSRGAGTNLTATSTHLRTDIDGDARPAEGAWDLSADHFVSGDPPAGDDIKSIAGVALGDIKSVAGVAKGSIKSIGGVTK